MKFAVILPDGAADEPCRDLDGMTPLQAAHKPNLDEISRTGRLGTVVTVPQGFTPGSEVATLSLFGYDPRTEFTGRAPLEAAARGIETKSDELIFRCNFVTIGDGAMADFTAGHIGQTEADALIADLNRALSAEGCRFHSGVSYRNLMVMSHADGVSPTCKAPHDIPNQQVDTFLPNGPGSDRVRRIMEKARGVLSGHSINQVRRDLGENPATDIWLWGQGQSPKLQPFRERFGLSGAAIAAVDLIRGIASLVGVKVLNVPGATGFLDTNYAAKGRAAVAALESHDSVFVHIEAPDEAGHLGDAKAKRLAIERIDEHVVGPILAAIRRAGDWRILVAPDHPTPVERRIHTMTPPPFCMAGTNIPPLLELPFDEQNAAASGIHIDPGHELMEYFLKG
ncbi:MAG: cofactor-independent phosphoglycerate mutase [Planctomycetes bacterium]|nr:cofactor-independent phosphoglycerate mutase [Planctomycetota bacterium]MBI3836212.1 cofactor-independent phosphoglycerate mutase [Planctomycetota bacterium]